MFIENADLDNRQQRDLRLYALEILTYLAQFDKSVLEQARVKLGSYAHKLTEKLKTCSDDSDKTALCTEELQLIEKVSNAPETEYKSNFHGT